MRWWGKFWSNRQVKISLEDCVTHDNIFMLKREEESLVTHSPEKRRSRFFRLPLPSHVTLISREWTVHARSRCASTLL
jgi:recombinational DNA repair ATPase RecF